MHRVEELEPRYLLNSGPPVIVNVGASSITGAQITTTQVYNLTGQSGSSIFDTGCSAITFSQGDAGSIPIKVPGGAYANGFGGQAVGNVSQPSTISAAGFNTGTITTGGTTPAISAPTQPKVGTILNPARLGAAGLFAVISKGPGGGGTTGGGSGGGGTTPPQAPGIQAFVGTATSANMPTLTGTPILAPYSNDPAGEAAQISMSGGSGSLSFVPAGTALTGTSNTTAPVRISVSLVGPDNHMNPGNDITRSPVPITNSLVIDGSAGVPIQGMLLDTGAQVTAISTSAAQSLGLDLTNPPGTLEVEGVGGPADVPSFVVSQIQIPTKSGSFLELNNVPVAVLNLGSGIDGVLGMNVFNTASSMIYDPYNTAGPVLSVTFNKSTSPAPAIPPGASGPLKPFLVDAILANGLHAANPTSSVLLNGSHAANVLAGATDAAVVAWENVPRSNASAPVQSHALASAAVSRLFEDTLAGHLAGNHLGTVFN
jgi:hypothetical protein